ncbi:hypothetical protein DYBT9275_02320 [Dyadobacter sp. CECT 9275]|uniref:Uncharacterized protein n=1 Tax=Dyadobacter helix TaxID=2822344 RepID=A0A916JBX0_9BACT|nr:hypothetical protein DYBT9275_02320 [Dyadobacter sp. CECT 9275]
MPMKLHLAIHFIVQELYYQFMKMAKDSFLSGTIYFSYINLSGLKTAEST